MGAQDGRMTDAHRVRLDAFWEADWAAESEAYASRDRRHEAEAEAEPLGPQNRVYYFTPAGSDHPLPVLRIADPGDGGPVTYTLGGQSCGRDVAVWALTRYRAKRAAGGRLERMVSGRGYHFPPRPRSVWGEIDENIAPLVDALNAVPGVQTVASCGGHDDPEPHYQHPAGSWFVYIEPAAGLGAWLAAVALLRGVVAESPRLRLKAHKDGYHLTGADGVDPHAVAVAIRERNDAQRG